MNKVNISEIEEILATMKPRTKVFNVVKSILKSQGRWKNLPRGKHAKT